MTFCQCNCGWSGKFCNFQHKSMCSLDSIHMGVSGQYRSVCLCPINRIGPRCLIIDRTCSINQNNTCQNGGQCIANNDLLSSRCDIFCICPKGLHGKLCQTPVYNLTFSFAQNAHIPFSIYIYVFSFMLVTDNDENGYNRRQYRGSIIYQRFSQNRKSVHYCVNIITLINQTILNLHYFQRAKYYHSLCAMYLNLSCFQDDISLCVCCNHSQERLANCVNSDKNHTMRCSDDSFCQLNGQCFKDQEICSNTNWCVCNPCYYGTQCQFSTNGFGLSIDNILGYHIETQTKLIHQPIVVQISVILTIIYLIMGFINTILCLMTFKNKTTHEVGCGLYLLSSLIVTFILTILFGLKMLTLICTQIYVVDNQLFLLIQCHSLDFLLHSCLYINRWLSTSVATERSVRAIQVARFSKVKSKRTAKFIIVFLMFFIMSTNIHEAIYRKLINDEYVKPIWCISDYSSSSILSTYNSIIHTFHFFAPFSCDLIASLILITIKSHYQANLQKYRTFKQIFRQQFQEHTHLFLAPLVLVILAIPALIIIYTSKCMESVDDTQIYLTTYFISFIPPMLTFAIFILPSKFYKKEFKKTIKQYRTNIQRRFHFIS